MSLIKLTNIGIEFAGEYIFRDVSCSIGYNSRIGLIGANGSGKSTLFKIFAKELAPSEGIITGSKQLAIAYLPQNPEVDTNMTVIQYIHSARPDIIKAWQKLEDLSLHSESNTDPFFITKYQKAQETFERLGGYEFEIKMKLTLTNLKFPIETWHKNLSSFSGGERSRLALAHILLSNYDILLLDEPTNHLDISMINWLEKFLMNINKPYIIISHDRFFLDKTVSTIYYLDSGRLFVTKGNYSSWHEANKIKLLEQERKWKIQNKYIKETKEFISQNISGQKTKQAQSRQKLLNKIQIIEKPNSPKHFNLYFEAKERSGNDVFRIENLSITLSNWTLVANVNLYCGYRDRICILGKNGCGKTTLLKVLIGKYPNYQGIVKAGANLRIGYYDQYQQELDSSLTVYDIFRQVVPYVDEEYVLSWLARFGFRNDNVKKRVSILSGGEKSRLYLMLIIHMQPNVLILDEPTNHLDIEMMDGLLSALLDYDGTIIFVSHDRFFIQKLASKYWVFCTEKMENTLYRTVKEINKPFPELLELVFNEPILEKPKTQPTNSRIKKTNPWLLNHLLKQIENQYQIISMKEKELNDVYLQLSHSDSYTDATRFRILQTQMKKIEQDLIHYRNGLENLENKYLELSYEGQE